MSARLVIRRDDGRVESVSVTGQIDIGSGPQSDVRIEGDGVLALHAKAGVDGGEYWIQDAGNAGIAINGQRVGDKRTLRHLDVITVGSSVSVIFSTTAVTLPAPPPTKRPLSQSKPSADEMTVIFRRSDAPKFTPAASDAAEPENTVVRIAPAGVPAFQSADTKRDAPNTVMGTPRPWMPKFDAVPDGEAPETVAGTPGKVPKLGTVGAGKDPETIIASSNMPAVPQFERTPSLMETVMPDGVTKEGVTPPRPVVRSVRAASDLPIKSVTLRGIGAVLSAPLGRHVIGRGSAATIRIDSKEVSKEHAVLEVTPTEVILTNQSRVNGTAVNGNPMSAPRRLVEGDRVLFATLEFRVEFVRTDGRE